MHRREALGALGSTLLGANLFSGTGKKSGVVELANAIEVEQVGLSPYPMNRRSIDHGVPVSHQFGWKTSQDEGVEKLRDTFDVTSYEAYFDGKRIPNPSRYWGSLQSTDDDQWEVKWNFILPYVPPGKHRVLVMTKFEEPFTSKSESGGEVTRSGTDMLTARYEVVR